MLIVTIGKYIILAVDSPANIIVSSAAVIDRPAKFKQQRAVAVGAKKSNRRYFRRNKINKINKKGAKMLGTESKHDIRKSAMKYPALISGE